MSEAPSADVQEGSTSHNEDSSASAVVLGIICGFLVGLLIRTISNLVPLRYRKLTVPFTACVLVSGLVVGFIVVLGGASDTMTEGLRDFESIDPTVLFAVFMPALLTPSGLMLDFHQVGHVWFKAFTLAIPETMINAALITVVARYVFPYEWSWAQSSLIGSILSATDPIAVISIMESCGSDPKLTTVINGESLLNDGVAYVMFEIFLGWAEGEPVIGSEVVKFVFRAALGGPALGIAFALAVMIWFQVLYTDTIAIITVSLTAVYSVWILSDQILSLSAVLAVLFFSMFLGLYGKSRIGPRSRETFDFFWHWTDWIANSLIFFLSGLIIAVEVSDQNEENNITGKDWGIMFALYFLLLPIRAFSTILLSPLLTSGKYGLNFKDMLVLSWSGLRGAVGLTLSLIVYNSPDVADEKFRVLCFFNVGMISVLTLLIQGSTTGPLLKWLGYTDIPGAKKNVQIQSATIVDNVAKASITEAKDTATDSLLGAADWNIVYSVSNIGVAKYIDSKNTGVKKRVQARGDFTMHEKELLVDLRERLLRAVYANYNLCFSQEYLTPSEMSVLTNSMESASDALDMPLSDWDALYKYLDLDILEQPASTGSWKDRISKLNVSMKRLVITRSGPLGSFVKRNVAMTATFLAAHSEARRQIRVLADLNIGKDSEGESTYQEMTSKQHIPYWDDSEFKELEHLAAIEQLNAPEEVNATNRSLNRSSLLHAMTMNRLITSDDIAKIFSIVLEESMLQTQKAEEFFAVLRNKEPESFVEVATEFVAIDILRKQYHMLELFHHLGLFEEEDVQRCQHMVLDRMRKLR